MFFKCSIRKGIFAAVYDHYIPLLFPKQLARPNSYYFTYSSSVASNLTAKIAAAAAATSIELGLGLSVHPNGYIKYIPLNCRCLNFFGLVCDATGEMRSLYSIKSHTHVARWALMHNLVLIVV